MEIKGWKTSNHRIINPTCTSDSTGYNLGGGFNSGAMIKPTHCSCGTKLPENSLSCLCLNCQVKKSIEDSLNKPVDFPNFPKSGVGMMSMKTKR